VRKLAQAAGRLQHFSPLLEFGRFRRENQLSQEGRAVRIDVFRMERMQSQYENQVQYNLSESGVLPMRLEELLEGEPEPARFLSLALKYPQSNGSEELRERIALFYGGAQRDNVLVTTGGSEANYAVLWGLLEKADRVACMLPNYMQAWGLSRAYAGRAEAFWLVERRGNGEMHWALDLESLERAVTKKTRLIVVTNPNNPTGAVLTEREMEEVLRLARRANAWLLADEIYRGAELDGPASPSFWGRYDKLLITSGLSKAFGLPGLRIGWVVGPAKTVAKLWSRRDYTTIAPGVLSDRLAGMVMEPGRREAILARTRAILHNNLPLLERWLRTHDDIFAYIRPLAGAIAYIRYNLPVSSTALATKLRLDRSVLIVPGEHFGMGRYIRVGYGYDTEALLRGLARIDLTLEELQKKSARPGLARRLRRFSAGGI